MIPITNIYKRLLAYTLVTNKFPLQCAESIWYLIQLSELPIELQYTNEGFIKCRLVSYAPSGKRTHAFKELQPRNPKESQIVETFLQMIYNTGIK